MERTREEVGRGRKGTLNFVVGVVTLYALVHWGFASLLRNSTTKSSDFAPFTYFNTLPDWIVFGFWPIDLVLIGTILYFASRLLVDFESGDTITWPAVVAYIASILTFVTICFFGWFTGLVVALVVIVVVAIVGVVLWYGIRGTEWLLLKIVKALSACCRVIGRVLTRTTIGAKVADWFQATDVPENPPAPPSDSPAAP